MNSEPESNPPLNELLASFDTLQLGEGDPAAGANLLAAMAITLANLARPGSGILMPNGRLLQVGCDLLASGSLATSLILDEVVTPVGRCQANLLAQLERLLEDDAAESAKSTPREWKISRSTKASHGEQAMFRLATSHPDMPPLFGSYADEWATVVGETPSQHLADLVRRSRFFISAATPGQLEKQIPGAHLSQALVALGFNRVADMTNFGKLCPYLMDGLLPAGPCGEPTRGRFLITDPHSLLREAVTAKGEKSAWLGRLIWLVDGNANSGSPALPTSDKHGDRLPNLTARFERATQLLLGNRLDSHEPRPVVYEYDFSKRQASWMAFLRGMENELPGICGAARNLFPTLVFGLNRLVSADQVPGGFKFSVTGIAAFARHIIRRMATHRATALCSAEEAWKLRYKRKILQRLETDLSDTRNLYRRLHIRAAPCRELLNELEAGGLVKLSDGKWQRIEGATLPADHRN